MPEQVQSTASLLTLTASKPSRPESPRDAAGDFNAELAAAVEETDAKPSKPSTKQAAPDSEPSTAANETSAAKEDATDSTPVEADGDEAETLAALAVTETIVLETAPDVVLPEDAVTSIDVEAGATTDGEAAAIVDASAIIDVTLDAAADPDDALSVTTNGESDDAQLVAAATSADGLLGAAQANSGQEQSAEGPPNELLEEALATPSGGPAASEASGADPVVEADKASTKQHNADSQEVADPNLASAAESALALGALPQESASEPADPSASSETTDRAGANGAEGPTPRDTARAEAADKAAAAERPTIDPARFVSRVSRAIEFADQRGGGPVEMRLSPPELGSLQVKIQVKDGVMTAKMEVETPAARNALLDNLPALRDRLEQQQIRIDKFDVEVRDNQQQRGGDWRQPQDHRQQMDQQQQQPRGDSRQQRQPAAPAPAPSDRSVARPLSVANNGINLVV